nr:solute carrier family 46 member 3-like [Dermatophagoides farinae]
MLQGTNIIQTFQIEIFVFIFTLASTIEDVTVQLAAQDKFCMHRLNSTRICSQLSSIDQQWHSSDVLLIIKDEVLVQVTMFNFYQTIIATIPLLFTSLFISSWADRHRKSAKILLSITTFMCTMESLFLLINVINFHWNVYIMLISFTLLPMVGGTQVVAMTVIAYLTIVSDSQQRIKRFAIIELIAIVAGPLGVLIGGLLIREDLLPPSAWAHRNGQLHNYHYVILVALFCKAFTLIYVLLTKFRKRPKCNRNVAHESDPLIVTNKPNNKEKKKMKKKKSTTHRARKYVQSVGDIFVIRNISESFQVCYRRRRNQRHVFIWMLMIAMTLVTMTRVSLGTILFQFVQKVYYWDASLYSTFNAILYITTHVFGLMVATPTLTNLLHLSDSSILVIGLLSIMAQNFIRGTIINVTAFCLSYLFGSLTSLVSVSIRAKLSKLIASDEQYRLFGMLTMMEAISPLLGVSIYTQIFNQTISIYPGFVFQFSCFILLLPIVITTFITFYLPTHHQNDDDDDDDNNVVSQTTMNNVVNEHCVDDNESDDDKQPMC